MRISCVESGAGFGILSSVSKTVSPARAGPPKMFLFAKSAAFRTFALKSDFRYNNDFSGKVLHLDKFEIFAKTASKSLHIPLCLQDFERWRRAMS